MSFLESLNIEYRNIGHEDVLTIITIITISGGNSIISKTKDKYTLHVSVLLLYQNQHQQRTSYFH